MLLDFIARIPYYIVRFFVPNSVWEVWLNDCRAEIRFPLTGTTNHLSPRQKIDLRNRTERVYRSVKGRLVRTRWPYSI